MICWERLKLEEVERRFASAVDRKMEEREGEEVREDSTGWTKVQEVVLEAAKEVCGEAQKRIENPWMVGKEEELRKKRQEPVNEEGGSQEERSESSVVQEENHSLQCGIAMGSQNPRQLCGKTECLKSKVEVEEQVGGSQIENVEKEENADQKDAYLCFDVSVLAQVS